MVIGKPKFLLRWRFDFSDGKTKYGMWNSVGPKQHGAQMAWSTNKENLISAQIEGKDIHTREVKTLVACDGHDFVNMKWFSAFRSGVFATGRFQSNIIGMIMQTRELDVCFLIDGNHGTKKRTEYDKNFHYAGFGK